MDPKLREHSAKPGDLIQISHGKFDHWAIYIGGNEVVHLSPSLNVSDSVSKKEFPLGDELGRFGNAALLVENHKARVKRQHIWEVVSLKTFQINNFLDDEYKPRERHLIVKKACQLVGQELLYSVYTYNCEHFATWLRYGKAESRQVKKAAVVGGVAAASVGIIALGSALLYLLNEEERDIMAALTQQDERKYLCIF